MNLSPVAAAAYLAEANIAYARARPAHTAIMAGWVATPFLIQTMLHPKDGAILAYMIYGVPVPHTFTTEYLVKVGVYVAALMGLVVWLQYLGMRAYFKKMRQHSMRPPTWPMSIIVTGIIGNGLWWFFSGFDLNGFVVGFAPTALAFGCETLCEKLAKE